MNLQELDRLMGEHRYEPSGVIAMLQDLQRQEGYLPRRELELVAERVGIPAIQVYGLATFYKSFSLVPRGRHLVSVCMGTACHVRGGARIMDKICRDLGVEEGGTTPDRKFTVEAVRCVGCCGLAPVVSVDGEFHGKITQRKVPKVIGKYE